MATTRTATALRALLEAALDDDEPVFLSPVELDLLTPDDVAEGVAIEVGLLRQDGVREIEWDGELHVEHGEVVARTRHLHTRKYWYSPLGLYHHMDLVRRAVEVRARTLGDVEVGEFDDDGAYIHLTYAVRLAKVPTLRAAYERVLKVQSELGEA
jgi:hypothetical protein